MLKRNILIIILYFISFFGISITANAEDNITLLENYSTISDTSSLTSPYSKTYSNVDGYDVEIKDLDNPDNTSEKILNYVVSDESYIDNGFNNIYNNNMKDKYTIYVNKTTKYVYRGLYRINNKIYCFDKFGIMKTGWQTVGGKRYYFKGTGEAMIGSVAIGKYWYYFNATGQMQTGIQEIYPKYYCYYGSNGVLQTGWQTVGGNKYYFKGTGEAMIGSVAIGKYWYYFNATGQMQTGIQEVYPNHYYYYNSSGVLQTGWQTIGGKRYYFKGTGEALIGSVAIGKYWYYFNATGQMQTGLQEVYPNHYYYYNSSGVLKTGWQTIGGKRYYFKSTGEAMIGSVAIGKYWYYFNAIGQMQTGIQEIYPKYYCYYNSNGVLQTGWQTIGGNKYYFKGTGEAMIGSVAIGKYWYYFNATGQMQTGLQEVYPKYYYYYNTSSGKLETGWKTINGKYYYFSSAGQALIGRNIVNDVVYLFDEYGATTSGYYTENGNTYFRDGDGNLVIGFTYIYGVKKFFDNTGALKTYANVIDVSYAQGTIDWAKVKATKKIDAVILRMGYTGYGSSKSLNTDDTFIKNLKALKANNIPYGIYYWGFARNATKAIQEAKYVLTVINTNQVKPTYGVWYDAEIGGSARTVNNNWALTRGEYEAAAPAFMNTITAAGFKTGIYSNASAFFSTYKVTYNSKKTTRSTTGYLNSSKIKAYPMWVAHYNTKCSSHYSTCGYVNYNAWQYSSSGSVSGISGNVDMNYWYK